jgi:RNA polymerase sigma-70 factor (ECF subfamily)
MPIPDRESVDRHLARLVLRTQSGDRDALDAALRSIQDAMFRYLKSLVSDEHVARDVLQETFLFIVRNLGRLREPRAFRSWAFRIASREAFRELKWRKR